VEGSAAGGLSSLLVVVRPISAVGPGAGGCQQAVDGFRAPRGALERRRSRDRAGREGERDSLSGPWRMKGEVRGRKTARWRQEALEREAGEGG